MTDALKPCPFCGGPVRLEQTDPTRDHIHGMRDWWGVVCRNTENVGGSCAIQQRLSASKEAAIKRWNTRAALAAPAVPPGWVLVPVEPTEAQMLAGEEAFCATARPGATWAEHTGSIYRAMLAAAPGAPDAQKGKP